MDGTDMSRNAAAVHRQILGEKNNVIIPKLYIEFVNGDYVAAVILKEIVWGSGDYSQTAERDGWMYNSEQEWEEQCCVSRKQVNRSITVINTAAGGELIQKRVGKRKNAAGQVLNETVTYYRLDTDMYTSIFWNVQEGNSGNVHLGNSQNVHLGNSLSYNTGTTTGTITGIAPKRKTKQATPVPSAISDEAFMWARKEGLNDREIQEQSDQFRDHHTAKGTMMKDWNAAFRTWIRNAKGWGRLNNGTNGNGGRPKPAYFDNKGGYTAEGLAAKARGEI